MRWKIPVFSWHFLHHLSSGSCRSTIWSGQCTLFHLLSLRTPKILCNLQFFFDQPFYASTVLIYAPALLIQIEANAERMQLRDALNGIPPCLLHLLDSMRVWLVIHNRHPPNGIGSLATGPARITYHYQDTISAFALAYAWITHFVDAETRLKTEQLQVLFPISWRPPLSKRSFMIVVNVWLITKVMNVGTHICMFHSCTLICFSFPFFSPSLSRSMLRWEAVYILLRWVGGGGGHKENRVWVQATTSPHAIYNILQRHPDFFFLCPRLKGDMEHQRKAVESSIQKVSTPS